MAIAPKISMKDRNRSRLFVMLAAAVVIVMAASATVIAARRGPADTRLRVATDIANPTYTANVTSGDGMHGVNEVAMVVGPTWSHAYRGLVDMGYVAFMRNPISLSDSSTVVLARGQPLSGAVWQLINPPMISPYNRAGDPVLAVVPGGIGAPNANRVYLAARTWQSGTLADEISVWYIDGCCGSSTLTYQAGFVPSVASDMVDKPAIAVSSHSGSLGYIYLAYLRAGDPMTIWFARNPGGNTWTTPTQAYDNPSAHSLQGTRVDVDAATGTIYLSWVDRTIHTVNVRTSTDLGASWSAVSSAYVGAALLTNSDNIVGGGGGYVFSPSLLSSSFNSADQSLALVYHRRKGTSGAEVVMQRFKQGSFDPPQIVSGLGAGHVQWQGAVACGTDSTCVVAYYDHSDADPGAQYKIYSRRVSATGTSIGEGDTTIYDTLSDPSWFDLHRMEYHDVYYRNGRWYSANVFQSAIGNPGTADVLFTYQ